MKRKLLIAALACLSVISCTSKLNESDSITVLVAQGFGKEYLTTLARDVKDSLGIDLVFINETAASKTDIVVLNDFKHQDLKADIIFSDTKIPEQYLACNCLDFNSNSNLTAHYEYQKMAEFISSDGGVYQLPLSSRLVGITYNETLMEEMGWKLPVTFNDMLDLKKKCDAAGIPFAVTDLKFAEYAFDYLFGIMGAQWLSTIKGTVWLEGFQKGTKSIDLFKKKAKYFEKWVDSGLFGILATQSVPTAIEFGQRRALFCYCPTTADSYKGDLFDKGFNKTGRILNDKFKIMPWISEDGSNNCFTVYNNCWVLVNGNLAGENKKSKRNKVIQVIEFMMGEKYANMVAAQGKDIFLSFNKFQMGPDRMYYEYRDNINLGYYQPWYRDFFNRGIIEATGAEVSSYIQNKYQIIARQNGNAGKKVVYEINPNADFDSAIGMLRDAQHLRQVDYLGWAQEKIEVENCAKLISIAAGMAMQKTIDEDFGYDAAGNEIAHVDVALFPYVTDLKKLRVWYDDAILDHVIYQGRIDKSYLDLLTPPSSQNIIGIWMTGKQIKEIVETGYDPTSYNTAAKNKPEEFETCDRVPYAMVTRQGITLKDDQEYLVAASVRTIDKDVSISFRKSEKMFKGVNGLTTIATNLPEGIRLYFQKHPVINNSNIIWD